MDRRTQFSVEVGRVDIWLVYKSFGALGTARGNVYVCALEPNGIMAKASTRPDPDSSTSSSTLIWDHDAPKEGLPYQMHPPPIHCIAKCLPLCLWL